MLGYAAIAEVPISALPATASAELNVPANVAATSAGSRTIDLTWDDTNADPLNETGTEIERSLDGVSGWALLHTADPDETEFTDTTGLPETEYFYRLRAVDATLQSEYSDVVSATTAAAGVPETFLELVGSHARRTLYGAKSELYELTGTVARRTIVGA